MGRSFGWNAEKIPSHIRYGTIKTSPCSKAINDIYRYKLHRSSLGMVASWYSEWNKIFSSGTYNNIDLITKKFLLSETMPKLSKTNFIPQNKILWHLKKKVFTFSAVKYLVLFNTHQCYQFWYCWFYRVYFL